MLEESGKMVADTANRLGNAVQDLRQLIVRPRTSYTSPRRADAVVPGLDRAGSRVDDQRGCVEGEGNLGGSQCLSSTRNEMDFAHLSCMRVSCNDVAFAKPQSIVRRSLPGTLFCLRDYVNLTISRCLQSRQRIENAVPRVPLYALFL